MEDCHQKVTSSRAVLCRRAFCICSQNGGYVGGVINQGYVYMRHYSAILFRPCTGPICFMPELAGSPVVSVIDPLDGVGDCDCEVMDGQQCKMLTRTMEFTLVGKFQEYKTLFFETSASSGEGVTNCMKSMAV